MDKKQIERIRKMEACLDESEAAIRELSEALQNYEEIRNKYYELEDYYGSTEWMTDYEADESGTIPADLKRGVLSEDAVYDLLTEHRELMTRMQRAVLKSLEEKEFKGFVKNHEVQVTLADFPKIIKEAKEAGLIK